MQGIREGLPCIARCWDGQLRLRNPPLIEVHQALRCGWGSGEPVGRGHTVTQISPHICSFETKTALKIKFIN